MSRPLLESRDLRKTYRLGRIDVPVLKGCSMHVDRGEFLAVLGSSGSGKSTLMHVLGGLDRPDRDGGEVLHDGQPLAGRSERHLNRYRARTIGFVFQFYHLLPELTVLENAMLPGLVPGGVGSGPARRRATMLLDRFGLSHRLNHRPRELSGGERQRTAIARAMANDPEVLLADEPTGNLDEHTGGEILELLSEAHRDGLTIVMVTHDHLIADRADRAIHLVDGVLDTATPAGALA
ncbi:MAG: ABC transporter ATP-binding protein [Phycisphaerales bacterium]|jgi:lipoprotein-releasing system ATP-binding protein|nr:ABC transporter ATP-binding protein [Phycisphaerales bacterium]MDP6891497.1 ABC transporter ATP-binding protein [Phycisphaerales bacterium]